MTSLTKNFRKSTQVLEVPLIPFLLLFLYTFFYELLFQENFKLFNHLEGQDHNEESDTCFAFDKTIALYSVKYLKSSSPFHEKVDISLYFSRS